MVTLLTSHGGAAALCCEASPSSPSSGAHIQPAKFLPLLHPHAPPIVLRRSAFLSIQPWEGLPTKPPRAYRLQLNAKTRNAAKGDASSKEEEMERREALPRSVTQVALWILAAVYVLWLFLLPYAPGEPIWAIKPFTISMVKDLSLNFFFIFPLLNAVGFHLAEAPVIHPTAEGLFNFVIGWTVMFAPLLFTDQKRDRYKGSLVALWLLQMLLTNTLLIPYMAIRLNQASGNSLPSSAKSNKLIFSKIHVVMIRGAHVVGLIGSTVGLISLLWFLIGRPNAGFGDVSDRWTFFLGYLRNDRLGYAFAWDICLYSVFQPWLIGDNLSNVDGHKAELVKALRFLPYVGLVAYLWGLARDEY